MLFISCNNQSDTASTNTQADTDTTSAILGDRPEVRLEQVWATDSVLETPESVYYNPNEKVLYVSNIVGDPSEKDSRGYISKISLEGDIIQKEWVTGLHAPKGMAMMNNTLYVTNIDELVAIDPNGSISKRYPVQGAKFLNDPVEADGKILFTDMEDNKIYALQNDKVEVWKEGDLDRPNGLAYHNGQLYLASADLMEVQKEGESRALAEDIGFGDGVVIVDDNSFLVSNWEGEVYYVERGKEKMKVLDTKEQNINSADIEYIRDQNLLLVPTFRDNRVVAYRLQK